MNGEQQQPDDVTPPEPESCRKIREFITAETSVILRHLEKHKWFRHIPTENEGVADFIKQYGWLMREMYCGYACEERETCAFVRDHLQNKTSTVILEPDEDNTSIPPSEAVIT